MNTGFTPKNAYSRDELVDCGYGRMFGRGNARLPVGNMLMLDRIMEINDHGGEYGKGQIIAELDIRPDLWFFRLSFSGRPRYAWLSWPGRHVATGRILSGLARQSGQRQGAGLGRGQIQRRNSAQANNW
jgi:hypothetical protein